MMKTTSHSQSIKLPLLKMIVCLTSGSPECQTGYDFYSRYFAPWAGIPEDPVTGRMNAFPSNNNYNHVFYQYAIVFYRLMFPLGVLLSQHVVEPVAEKVSLSTLSSRSHQGTWIFIYMLLYQCC